MPDFERMARDAEDLAASVDSLTQRNTLLEIADTWRRLASRDQLTGMPELRTAHLTRHEQDPGV